MTQYKAGRLSAPPVIDILIVSGGGDWGAFGAGFLKGWGQVPPGPMARPQFDIVTGVSTGALIAPFAFLGTDETIETIVQLYRHPKPDWVKQRGMLYFLPNNISFAEVPGLEREMRERIDLQMIKRLVGGRAGWTPPRGEYDQRRQRRHACLGCRRGGPAQPQNGRRGSRASHPAGIVGDPRRLPLPRD